MAEQINPWENRQGTQDTSPKYDPSNPWASEVLPTGVHGGGAELRPNDTSAGAAISSSLSGVYNKIAEGLGVPVEAVGTALRHWGLTKEQYGSATEGIKEVFRQAGLMNKVEPNIFWSNFGNDATIAALELAATIGIAAPVKAATEGAIRFTPRVINAIATFFKERPGMAAVQTATGQLGASYAQSKGGSGAAQTIYSITGAYAGDIAARSVSGIARTVTRAATGAAKTALQNSAFRPEEVIAFAKQQVQHDLIELDDTIAKEFSKVKVGKTPEETGRALYDASDAALVAARKVETKYWEAIPKAKLMFVEPIKDAVKKIRDTARLDSSQLGVPQRWILEKVDQWAKLTKIGTKRQIKSRQIIAFRKELVEEMRDVVNHDGNKFIVENLQLLIDSVDETIRVGMPLGEAKVAQALEFSTRLNDIFTRGPVGQILKQGKRNIYKPELTGGAVLGEHGAGRAFVEAQNLAKGGFKPADNPEVVARFDEAMKAHFEEVLGTAQPQEVEKARKWLGTHKGRIDDANGTLAELDTVLSSIELATGRKAEVNKSAFAHLANAPALQTAQTILHGKDPGALAREIMDRIANSPGPQAEQAHMGLKTALIDHIYDRTAADPRKMVEFLNNPTIRSALKEVFDPKEMKRMDKLAKNLVDMSGLGTPIGKIPGARVATIIAGVSGAGLGRALNTGTIQAPGIFASFLRSSAAKLFGNAIPMNTLFKLAVTDPRWEKVINTRAPRNSAEMKSLNLKMRTLLATAIGVQTTYSDKGE